jgi:hypothetical protein
LPEPGFKGFDQPAPTLGRIEKADLEHCKAARTYGVPGLVMMKTKGIKIHGTEGLADFQGDSAGKREM